jgi:ketosteroid isomerase-like protein
MGMGHDTLQALVERWAELFNTDVEALVEELYSPDCLFSGAPMGHDKLLKFERRVLAAAPSRAIRLDAVHVATGDVVVAEGALVDPDQGADWNLPFCAVLTVDNGTIISDNTYADYSRWPGMS